MAQGVERGEPGAHERSRLCHRQFGRHKGNRARWGDHVFPVAAIEANAGDLTAHAGEEIPAAAVLAVPAVATVPADTNLLACLPLWHARSDRVDHARHFVTGNPRI